MRTWTDLPLARLAIRVRLFGSKAKSLVRFPGPFPRDVPRLSEDAGPSRPFYRCSACGDVRALPDCHRADGRWCGGTYLEIQR